MIDEELLKLIENDDSGLLDFEKKVTPVTSEGRLVESFLEINNFYREHCAEPILGKDIHEHRLATRLKHLRENVEQKSVLINHDEFGLLAKKNNTDADNFKDIFEDDDLGLLDIGNISILDLKNVPKRTMENQADFIAKRKPCKDFSKYENLFVQIHTDIQNKIKFIVDFEDRHQIEEGVFFVLSGVVGYVASIGELDKNNQRKINGRLHIIFENGTESNMLLRSLVDSLHAGNGKIVRHILFDNNQNLINENDAEVGYIYVLRSLSVDPQILSIKDLYKIGFSTSSVEKRIENAKDDPTYLMAPVAIVSTFKCFNMNPHKLERLLHRFFTDSCLNIDITDKYQNRYTPKEWFIVPINIVEQSISFILSGEIIKYKYDKEKGIIERN